MQEDFDLDALLNTIPDIGLAELVRRPDSEFDAARRAYETALPRGYLSQSQIGLFLKCGRAYELRYVLGVSSRGNSNMAQGSAVHVAADTLHKSILNKDVLTLEAMKDAYADAHDKAFDKNLDLEIAEADADLGAVKDRGMALVDTYRQGALGLYTPLPVKGEPIPVPLRGLILESSERTIRTTIVKKAPDGAPAHEPVPMVMILDIEEPHAVRDLKVRSKKPNDDEAENSLQLALYAGAVGKPDVSIDALVKPSAKLPARYMRIEAHISAQEQEHAVTIASEVADDIRDGRFRRTDPNNWWCSAGWCSYWQQCRGAKR